MTEAVIRPAKPGDGQGLARCWVDLCEYYAELNPDLFQVPEIDGLVDYNEKDLAKPLPEDAIWLVAEVDGWIVGWIYAHVVAPMGDAHFQLLKELGKSRVLIDALGVERPFRRRGIGTQLMRAVEHWARDRGAEIAFLDTYIDSPVSVPFYEALGYVRRSLVFQRKLGMRPGDGTTERGDS